MLYIKYITLFFIFLACLTLGRLLSKRYILRLNELRDMKNALNILENKIKFTYEPIAEIFKDISSNINSNISQIFKKATENLKNNTASMAWEYAIDTSISNLNS